MEDISKCMVFVVDDSEANIYNLAAVLDSEYKVCVAKDGKSVLEAVESKQPDLILLDVMMPGMDGYEVCNVIPVRLCNSTISYIEENLHGNKCDGRGTKNV